MRANQSHFAHPEDGPVVLEVPLVLEVLQRQVERCILHLKAAVAGVDLADVDLADVGAVAVAGGVHYSVMEVVAGPGMVGWKNRHSLLLKQGHQKRQYYGQVVQSHYRGIRHVDDSRLGCNSSGHNVQTRRALHGL